jgi:protein-disulfide isomerase
VARSYSPTAPPSTTQPARAGAQPRQAAKRTSATGRAAPTQRLSREARTLLLLGIPVLLVAVVLVLLSALSRSPAEVGPSASTVVDASTAEALVRPDSPVLGAADAPVTVVEFLDPECPTCATMYPVTEQLLDDYTGRVQLVVRYLPLHNNSVLAAQAAEAAGEQGKYAEMLEALFTTQRDWGNQSTPQTESFVVLAQRLELNVDQFRASLTSNRYAAKIERDAADARALGVRGTPTFFVNGQPVRDLSYAALKSAIETALARG